LKQLYLALMKLSVKICCIANIQEAALAINYGATAIGLVGPMPSGPGIISNIEIEKIAKATPQNIDTFLLTSETSTQNIINHHLQTKTNTIQLVDEVEINVLQDLKRNLPTIKIVQVVHILNEENIEKALQISQFVDALLLDSGNPNLSIKQLGGTGKVHNWQISKQIVSQCKIPVYLAGGLSAQNVRTAVLEVKPYGIDLCSSVRTNEKLDENKLSDFFKALQVGK
jgi:phosphoribosylanthranilate isomerase